MCNLYSNTTVPEAMRQLFEVTCTNDRLGNHQPLFSIFPGTAAPVVRMNEKGERELSLGRFGFLLPQVSKRTGKPILPRLVANSRQDKVLSSRFWRKSFVERRCLIPASAFCETRGCRPAIYHWFGVVTGYEPEPFAFAGIWKQFTGVYRGEAQSFTTYSIVTTASNALVRKVNPTRMPVILERENYATWLTGTIADARNLLRPFRAERMSIITSGAGMKSLKDQQRISLPDHL